jgi:hypothetical protein
MQVQAGWLGTGGRDWKLGPWLAGKRCTQVLGSKA